MENLTKVVAIAGLVVVMTVVLAWPVQLLWNSSLVPAVDGVNQITFWQALGINLLAAILFKNTSVKSND